MSSLIKTGDKVIQQINWRAYRTHPLCRRSEGKKVIETWTAMFTEVIQMKKNYPQALIIPNIPNKPVVREKEPVGQSENQRIGQLPNQDFAEGNTSLHNQS